MRILFLVVGFVILVGLSYRLGFDNILSLLRRIGWRFLVVVLIYGAEELIRAVAVLECLPAASRPSFRQMVYIRLFGEAVRAVTLTGPFLSEPTRAWFIRRQGVPSSAAAAAAIGEYAANSFVAAFLTAAGVIYLFNYVEAPKELRVAGSVLLYGSIGYLVIVFLLVYRRVYLLSAIINTAAGVLGLKAQAAAYLEGIRRTEEALLGVFGDRSSTLPRLLALEFAAHTLLLLETAWILISMGVFTSFATACLAEILTKLANVAFVGVTEGAYAFLFQTLGLPAAAGFTVSLVKRLRSMVVALSGLGSLTLIPNRGS